ncbi:MAG: DNA primase [Oscillospiraceae bacterium]|nr:DNA primase [Oscillospiraceae bacterium]
MPVPDSFIQDLVARTEVEPLISSYVPLKRTGRTLTGLCPFHNEKTPSFVVYTDTNSFYCFGCGVGGDVITFVKRIENLDYLDALKFLADRAGLRMPQTDFGVHETASKIRMRTLELNRAAARQFHEWLWQPVGERALAYYRGRGFTDGTIRHFGLGWAPDSFDMLRDAMRAQGFHDEELVTAFLCKKGRNDSLYDIFRGRVMFPIIDVRGSVIAVAGRVLDDAKPKYINPADTPVYNKSETLFALNFAKNAVKDKKQLILCEGYTDVIALHQAGFGSAVACCGTSFTDGHARLMTRYADEAVLVFDADAAGAKGNSRAINTLRQTGMKIRVVRIPGGLDPDEFIRAQGAERFRRLMSEAANDIEYGLIELAERYNLTTPDGQVNYLREAAALLAALPGAVERDVYAGKLAGEMNVSKRTVLQQMEDIRGRKKRGGSKASQTAQLMRQRNDRIKVIDREAAGRPETAAEAALLGLLMHNQDFLPEIRQILPPDRMAEGFHRRLYEDLLRRQEDSRPIEPSFLAAEYTDDEMAYIIRIQQQARNRAGRWEDARACAAVIEREHSLSGLRSAADLSDEEIRKMLDVMREAKK